MDPDATQVLLSCLSYADKVTKAEQLALLTAEEWRAAVVLARKHNVSAVLYFRLKQMGISLPDDLAEVLKQEHRQNTLINLRIAQQLSQVLRLLHGSDIGVIVLKGAYLIEKVYEDLGVRRMADVDLLVKEEDLARVEKELLSLGYVPEEYNRVVSQPAHHFAYRMPRNGLLLEVHWTFMDSRYPFNIDQEGLWMRAQPITLANAPTFTLSPEDLLLHLCHHTAAHLYVVDFRMLCDIGEVLRCFGANLDWLEIARRARQWGNLRATYLVLRLAQELLGAVVPADRLANLRPDGFDEDFLNQARARILAERVEENMESMHRAARLWGQKGWGKKMALARNRLLPGRKEMSLMYPASADSWRIFLYYPVRIVEMIRQYGVILLQLARGGAKTRTASDITRLREWLMLG